MTRLAIYLQDAHPINEAVEHARYAEAAGFEAVWQADSRLVRDAVVPMAAFAARTDTIKFGSGVVDCWTRNPARLASTFRPWTTWPPGGYCSASEPGGTPWPPRWVSTASGPLESCARWLPR